MNIPAPLPGALLRLSRRHLFLPLALSSLPLLFPRAAIAQSHPAPLVVEHGTYTIHLLLHAIGREEYTLTLTGPSALVLTTSTHTNDRGMEHSTSTSLSLGPGLQPISIQQQTAPQTSPRTSTTPNLPYLAEVKGRSVILHNPAPDSSATLTLPHPAISFLGLRSMPAATQMLMMRYWLLHHQPSHLPLIRDSAQALPLEIRLVGHDAFSIHGQMVRLTRYTVANLIFGREILWMNDHGRLAALMTFAGGLPQEEILDEYDSASGELFQSAVRQQQLDLEDLDRAVPPEASGTFAILGARLIDGTGAAPIPDSAVLIRDGRILAAGPAASLTIPPGTRIIHAQGESLLPGLWEMHTHYSGVEFGPALLSAGITTARDCGGELGFLLAVRNLIDKHHALGPRLLLAGLIDSGGPLAFGSVDVETPAQAIEAVDTYADQHFEQIKVYTQIQPAILRAISSEAHRRGLTVTGHVPAAVDAFQGIDDGMDQINHLQFVIRTMNPDAGTGPVDLHSERSRRLIALLQQRHIVVDPTDSWGEMAGHPRNLDPASFEPGLRSAPWTLASKYAALGVPATDSATFHQRMKTNAEVIDALYKAGVPIVAGSDTGLLGYGLDRELELYVQAGMSPMAAIQSATLVPARVMKLDHDSGSIEPGKRADLMLVHGDPLTNISDIRNVVSVVTDGRLYDSKKLARSVGFSR